MSQRIVVGNLPPDTTVEELAEVLANAGAEQVAITLNNEGDKSKVAAVIAFEDIDRATADRIAARINGMRYRERTLSAYVPLFM
jgi:RNA recognition motif-containing protein